MSEKLTARGSSLVKYVKKRSSTCPAPNAPSPVVHLNVDEWLSKYRIPSLRHRMQGGVTALHLAAYMCEFDMITLLSRHYAFHPPLDYGIDDVAENGCTPLMMAAMNGAIAPEIRAATVKRMITELGADVDKVNQWGENIVFVAIRYGVGALAEHMLNVPSSEFQKRISARTSDGRTAFFYACCFGQLDLLKFLFASCARSLPIWNDYTAYRMLLEPKANAFLAACRFGQTRVVVFLLERFKELIGCKDDEDNTPLTLACLHDDWPLCSALLHVQALRLKSSDLMLVANAEGYTPLMVAASCNNHIVVSNFLKRAIESDKVNACGDSSTSLLRRMLSAFVPLTGNTALHLACMNGAFETVHVLLEHGASPTESNLNRNNALHLAASVPPAKFSTAETIMAYQKVLLAIIHRSLPPTDESPLWNRIPIFKSANNSGNTPFLEAAAQVNHVAMHLMVHDLPRVLWHHFVTVLGIHQDRIDEDASGAPKQRRCRDPVVVSEWILPVANEPYLVYYIRASDEIRKQRNSYSASTAAHLMMQLRPRGGQNGVHGTLTPLASLRFAYEWVGCSVNETNNAQDTVLSLACLQGNLPCVQWLITSAGVNAAVWSGNAHGTTPIMNACLSGNPKLVAWLFHRLGNFAEACVFLLRQKDRNGMTALLYAVASGCVNLLRFIIFESAASSFSGVAFHGRSAVTGPEYWRQVLADEVQAQGKNAVLVAAECGRLKILKCIVAMIGAQRAFAAVDAKGETLLHAASRSDNARLLDYCHRLYMKCNAPASTAEENTAAMDAPAPPPPISTSVTH